MLTHAHDLSMWLLCLGPEISAGTPCYHPEAWRKLIDSDWMSRGFGMPASHLVNCSFTECIIYYIYIIIYINLLHFSIFMWIPPTFCPRSVGFQPCMPHVAMSPRPCGTVHSHSLEPRPGPDLGMLRPLPLLAWGPRGPWGPRGTPPHQLRREW